MRIFLSHSSKQKPLVREIKAYLPTYLGLWLDEERLLFGDVVADSLEKTIRADSDYVLLFIDEDAAESPWVKREIEWTLETERSSGRTILLSFVVDPGALGALGVEIQNRRYLSLKDFSEAAVRALADSIASELFALVCRDMDRLREPKAKSAAEAISEAESLLRAQAILIQKAVFPHRKANPITRELLRTVVNSQSESEILADDFENILGAVASRNLIPGLVYDGFELFLVEEHASWKAEIEHSRKERIGRRAGTLVQNGMKLFLDAGSTIEEIVRVLCKRIETRSITRVTIATTSINIADMISDCCVSMGFDDDFSAVRLFVPGGRIRPNTQAIVPSCEEDRGQLVRLADTVGGFDVGFIGVNGITAAASFTTHGKEEAANKRDIIKSAARSFVVGDSSKLGLELECEFAALSSNAQLVIDDSPESRSWTESLEDSSMSQFVTLA